MQAENCTRFSANYHHIIALSAEAAGCWAYACRFPAADVVIAKFSINEAIYDSRFTRRAHNKPLKLFKLCPLLL
jgi:hypothetical protein